MISSMNLVTFVTQKNPEYFSTYTVQISRDSVKNS